VRTLRTIALLAALAAAGTATAAPASAASRTVLIGASFYDPATVTIDAGDSVTWTVGQGRHTVTADTGAFDSGPLGEGQTFSFAFTAPGTYAYRDRLNPGIRGTVVVQATTNAVPSASFTATPRTAPAGTPVAFDASASKDADGHVARYQWDFDGDGVYETDTQATSRITRVFSRPGTISVGLSVTDDKGAVAAAAPVTVTITAAAPKPADDTPPSVDDLQVQPLRLCVRRAPGCRRPGGTVAFLLDERATVRVTVERLRPGRSTGTRVARFSRRAAAGRRRFALPLGSLRAGTRYRVLVQATDAAGNRSRTRRTTFTVRR
jgi:plastocyanin